MKAKTKIGNKEIGEEQEDFSDSETRRRPARSIAAWSSWIGRAAGAKVVTIVKWRSVYLEELQYHNRVLEGRGVCLALYKRRQSIALRKKKSMKC